MFGEGRILTDPTMEGLTWKADSVSLFITVWMPQKLLNPESRIQMRSLLRRSRKLQCENGDMRWDREAAIRRCISKLVTTMGCWN
jgi:hypothetical protein